MPRAEFVRTVGFVYCPVVTFIVLEGAVHIRVARNDPAVVKSVVVDGMVVAQLFVDRERIPLKLYRVEHSRVKFRSQVR